MDSKTNIENILKDKVKDLGEYLLTICVNETKKQDIKDALIGLPFYKILLFISFLDTNKIDNQIEDFIKIFQLNNSEDNRKKIREYIDYFIEIKTIKMNKLFSFYVEYITKIYSSGGHSILLIRKE